MVRRIETPRKDQTAQASACWSGKSTIGKNVAKETGGSHMNDKWKSIRGQAIIETALLLPWLIITFMAICNFGFFAYAGISTANAARVAAMYASVSPAAAADSAGICSAALEELRKTPGAGSLVGCSTLPVQVPAAALASSPGGVANGD